MIWVLIIALALAAGFLLALRGRRGHPGWKDLLGWNYAHRGLHDEALPENSMAAFRAAPEQGYGIELDLHLIKDGSLAVLHDHTLKRMTGREGKIEDLTAPELKTCFLQGTQETIPLFEDVLALFDGKAPMIIELKSDGTNVSALCEAAMAALKDYHGPYCIESFDSRCLMWLKKHAPQVIRGQLAEDYLHEKTILPWPLAFAVTYNLENFLTVPDFLAYRFNNRTLLPNRICRKLWGIQGVTWTLRNQADFDTAVAEGWVPIFEGFRP